MKKLVALSLVLVFIIGLVGCGFTKEHTVRIVIPAGSQEEYVYSDEEIMPLNGQLTMKSIDVADRTNVALKAVEAENEVVYTFLTKGEPMIVYAEKDVWYKIGIAMQNPTDKDIIVTVNIENAEVRID